MSKLLVSVREAADMLGISVRTVHKYCSLGVLAYVRVGKRKLIRTSDLLLYAERGISLETLKRVQVGIEQQEHLSE